VKNKPTLRGRRVEGFGQAAKTDAFQPQFLDGFDQLLHRARQAVELPHNQPVAAAREFQRLAQGWSIRHCADNCSVKILPHPASASASRCKARFWSIVETRA
jgi:hypothetical protein